ncbi:T9SS-dependent M36 family metallopeptidase [Chryseobacterium cucumeris]|uniref:T9SS-dependent M36 family metallopeptidase n=1 Tax=Chryseobacterium TaxID=59732 RepID=UPI00192DC7FB|nr:T9SS-dependent M36 family metallopeptidase [Chryseobacterium cucumeris]QRA42448.1 T9SS-dependent M36 family metallopeptidase [Chryseobacterium cucumeris]
MNKNFFLVPFSVAAFFASENVCGQNSSELIQEYYHNNGQIAQKSKSDASGIIILNEDLSKSLGARIVDVQQTYNGLRVYNAMGKVVIRENKIISEKNEFKRNIVVDSYKNITAKFSDDLIKSKLGLKDISEINYSDDVYFENNKVYKLAKELFVSDKNSSDVWHVIADANTGEILTKDNMTVSCRFEGAEYEDNSSEEPAMSHLAYMAPAERKEYIKIPGKQVPDNASYNVFPLPVEAPTFGARSIISNPWDLTASPEGWHSDGTNSYTITRGNNVYAYSDQNDTNTAGYSPDGGSSRIFDFPFADGRYDNPFTYKDAAITNLFYMNNKMHDLFYKFGFTESARNFQTNNFGNGGMGGDAVNAEAFDGSGLNNANFSPGYEKIVNGQPQVKAGRMQMYLYDRLQTADDPVVRYQYNSPASVASRPKVMTAGASFGPLYQAPVTGDLAIPVPADACTAPAAGSLTNKIAVITAANCEYSLKALNAQNAGALGVIMYKPSSDIPNSLAAGTYGGQVTIPTISIGKTEGLYLTGQLNNGNTINVTLNFDYSGFKNACFDNGTMAHEYGHGISNRMTAQGYSCLSSTNSTEQMGEGWSDFFGLMVTARPGDTSAVPRGHSTYTKNEPITGNGNRLAKYSPDFSINNYTYGKTNTNTEVHQIGFIWATMLWDLAWKYIEKYGYNNDLLASNTSGNAKVLQIVIDGLKLQPCSPTFIDGRDAILQADVIGNGGNDKCLIWNVFARRGLGVNASAGSKTVANDQVEDFTIPAECSTALGTQEIKKTGSRFIVFPNPAYDEFFVGNIEQSLKEVKITMFDMSGKLVLTDSRESGSKKAVSVKGLQKGVYMVHISQGNQSQVEKLIVR